MPLMLLPILRVESCQVPVPDDQQVLGILLLGLLREIEAPGYHGLSADNDDFVVGNLVTRVYLDRNPLVGEECRFRVFLPPPALLQKDLYLHAPFVRVQQGLRNPSQGQGFNIDVYQTSKSKT